MNLSQLQAAVQAKGYTTDTAAQQTQFINETYREICGMSRWKFLEAEDSSLITIVGQPNYSLTSTLNGGINLNGGNWRNLDSIRIQTQETPIPSSMTNLQYKSPEGPDGFFEYQHIDRNNSTPFHWTFFQQQLWFYPHPDMQYIVRIHYIQEPPDLSAPSDVPILPIQYHDVLVWGAVESMAFRERDWLGRQFAQQKKEEFLRRLQEEYWIQQRQTSSHVRKSGYWETNMPYPFVHEGF
jgi:hypothetical protein